MSDQTKRRVEVLKRLREEHRETVTRRQALLKEQTRIQQQIRQAIRERPRTVPEVAQVTGFPTHEVLWHITALRKYGEVVETGLSDDYYQYQIVKEGST